VSRLGKTWKNKEFLKFLISIYFVFFFLLFISKIETITKGKKKNINEINKHQKTIIALENKVKKIRKKV
jgi:hypothetical protein